MATKNFVVKNGLTVGTATIDAATGNLTVNNAALGTLASATTFAGSGANLTNLPGANVSGTVPLASTAGTVTTAAQPNITSTGTLTSLTVNALNVDGTTTIQQAIEKVTNDLTGSTGVIDYNLLDQAILYKSVNATANFNLNIKGNASTTLNSVMSNDQSMTLTFLNQNGATPYYLQSFLIDGVSQTVNYAGGVNPSAGTPNSIDSYTFNIMKTASSTYTILGTTGTYS